MRKPILAAAILSGIFGAVAARANMHATVVGPAGVTNVNVSTHPVAPPPVVRGAKVNVNINVYQPYGYAVPVAPSYTSSYYPTYYPSYTTSCYSCAYNGVSSSNPYGYSYSLPTTYYPTYQTYASPVYPATGYPYYSYSYPTYYTYPTTYSSTTTSTSYYYPSYYPYRYGTVSVSSPYGTGYGSFTPYSGSYAGPLGSFYYNRVPGYGGNLSYSSVWGSGSVSWQRYY